ncbi:Uncharacterised protein [Neisseria gonorrhoeae]|uniref:Uncharacterized protein n=1 Tax=Neisseria gonorrhoeae TaxID=485 RepID=A0A378W1D2_NEIGO|nr:Uncharacterised protein [Neisseria gonorrhoeae]
MLGVDAVVAVGVVGDGVVVGVGFVALNRLSAEPFYRTVFTLGPQGEFLPWISLFTLLEAIVAVTTPFSTLTSLTYLPLMSEADATPAEVLSFGHMP